jgi:hypothetical protein
MSRCTGVTDVSALGGLTTLTASVDVMAKHMGYDGVADVSALGGLTTLDMSGCRGVTDVSALGGLTTLSMCGSGVRSRESFL